MVATSERGSWVEAVALLGSLAIALSLGGCAALPRGPAVPERMTEAAAPPGIPNARYWLDGDINPMIRDVVRETELERIELKRTTHATDPMPPAYLLAISGGGDAGAFAAGLLTGWSQQGTRPRFKWVTGISAGALIAPFAYLGSKYDYVLRDVSLSARPDEFFRKRGVIKGLLADGMADSAPLRRIIAKYVTPDLLAEIAREYARGRFLLIGTTDLDAARPVLWNMGAIASSGAPGALHLFRQIMLASASIPGAVSPVMIDVDLDGKHFQEMHVDGGVINQVFLYPRQLLLLTREATRTPFARARRAFIIRNGRIDPQWMDTKRQTLGVGARAIDVLTQAQGTSDVDRIYHVALEDDVDFNLACIDPDFEYPHKKNFAPDYMQHLFDYSFHLASNGYPWHKAPATGVALIRAEKR